MSAQIVVDLPEPVGPVTSTRPRVSAQRRWMSGDSPSSSTVTTAGGIRRNTAAAPMRSLNALARKRRAVRNLVRVVRVVRLRELGAVDGRHRRLDERRTSSARRIGNSVRRMIEPWHRRIGGVAGAQVKIGCALRDRDAQQLLNAFFRRRRRRHVHGDR